MIYLPMQPLARGLMLKRPGLVYWLPNASDMRQVPSPFPPHVRQPQRVRPKTAWA
jgi:hypothetical protein